MVENGAPTEFFELSWDPDLAHTLDIAVGSSSGQSCWEYLTLYLVLLMWAERFRQKGFEVLGDNTAALSNSLSFKGRGGMARISKEIAWRKVRFAWRFAVGHLPSEANTLADALSRTSAPEGS